VTVTINSILLDFIIKFDKVKRNKVFQPLWIDQIENIDTRVYNTFAIKVEYTIRATDTQKYIFDQMLRSHTLVKLYDDINDLYGNIWVDSVNPMWVGDWNYLRPWEIVITCIIEELISAWIGTIDVYIGLISQIPIWIRKVAEGWTMNGIYFVWTRKISDGFTTNDIEPIWIRKVSSGFTTNVISET
jgi:hypothetical protein